MASSRTIIRNARIIAVPGSPPERTERDIVIENDRIRAVGTALGVEDGRIIDATDRIVIPGLVNAHLHSWQTALRGIASDWTLGQYVARMHAKCAAHFTPADVYIATLAAALGQIAAGTTTLGDWFHNNLTPEHSDAALAALQEAGIRAVLFNGTPPPRSEAHPRAEAERLLGRLDARGGLITLGMAVLGPLYAPAEIAAADLRLAREMGLVLSMHHSRYVPATDPVWGRLADDGLFGPKVNIVHGNHIDDHLLRRLVDMGVTFTVTPEVELAYGHGHPITGRLRDLGAAPSIGVDIESAIGSEVLVAARIALAHQRGADHAAVLSGGGAITALRSRDALRWITIEGARALGLQHKIGTLEAGMQADLILIDTRAAGMWSSHDPYAAALNAGPDSIEAVMIGGQWRKFGGALTYGDTDGVRQRLIASGERIAVAAGLSLPAAYRAARTGRTHE